MSTKWTLLFYYCCCCYHGKSLKVNFYLVIKQIIKINIYVLCAVLSQFSHVHLFATLWTTALQVPLFTGIFRQEYLDIRTCQWWSHVGNSPSLLEKLNWDDSGPFHVCGTSIFLFITQICLKLFFFPFAPILMSRNECSVSFWK